MARILVVDDEQNIGRAMSWELRGFEVKVVSSLPEALLSLCHEEFDAVICDWNLGRDETGERVLQVAAKMCSRSRRFIVSGVVPEALPSLLITGVAHRYIAKPWRPHEVRELVGEELRG